MTSDRGSGQPAQTAIFGWFAIAAAPSRPDAIKSESRITTSGRAVIKRLLIDSTPTYDAVVLRKRVVFR